TGRFWRSGSRSRRCCRGCRRRRYDELASSWHARRGPDMDEVSPGRRRGSMIGRLNHVAIAVRDIAKASNVYRETLGATVSEPGPQPARGVTRVFIPLPNPKIELLEPLGEGSPIAKFLERNPDGGIHHVCYEVDDIGAARDQLKARGARVLGDGEP